jgi:hypothetical protein
MFLRATLERNPELLDAAIELHRIRAIGPNTLILDIDRIVEKRTAHLSEGGASSMSHSTS